ncbi:hypothetical protein AUJ42_02205 [Candidatus Collierbacteria bacterium CG1_02_44_10]|uniref:Uncharacterized protein n=4 Tax=Candidatus Collieribacteriota TaxID=1752725 RepID=A0A2H0DTQ0_9BACT|nr:hypothetical protein [bacterium]OIN91125.1 MAG: hypothetical protein AUJ42_02205 [Candidatus Collierbacteria bacterium CG1_02_44_10]PIP85494.1 MAG: hypothetical protein COW83_03950 [Candidatus Collierbacteria bacterium CG22_combo_CG10-13_8_21_14_all_43_12]PIR99725.1 MAG: hypothetical protein COT86_02435 [Candidatus Collierbacteria bacterium CG10_big_fil_rev_8_21_14_0_10_43_36]PIZ24683.1 MAG: hypothetical protein COY48_01575 [Candidatus Collierbacteria bacterium CG_4_10_14_0_8_um_filter_43_86
MGIEISIQNINLKGLLEIPTQNNGLVIFTHGSRSERNSRGNDKVAKELHKLGMGTLLFDLLTEKEDEKLEDRFDTELLTERLIAVTKWCIKKIEIVAGVTRLFEEEGVMENVAELTAMWYSKYL